MNIFKKIINFLRESDRWKHLVYGMLIGLGANTLYCAEYVGVGVGAALEYKDKATGGKFDWIDLAMTVLGVNIGYGIRVLVLLMFGIHPRLY